MQGYCRGIRDKDEISKQEYHERSVVRNLHLFTVNNVIYNSVMIYLGWGQTVFYAMFTSSSPFTSSWCEDFKTEFDDNESDLPFLFL